MASPIEYSPRDTIEDVSFPLINSIDADFDMLYNFDDKHYRKEFISFTCITRSRNGHNLFAGKRNLCYKCTIFYEKRQPVDDILKDGAIAAARHKMPHRQSATLP
jgi:hypothetical protein